jgi:hypothetical protein
MEAVNATLPAGTAIVSVTVTGSSPIALVPQPALPLQLPRVATLELKVTATDLATISAWIGSLPSLPGYADAKLNSIEPGGSGVMVSVTMNVTDAAFANRFAEVPEGADGEADDAEAEEGDS